jgi:FHS family L-fucose permease-like MFS transporter
MQTTANTLPKKESYIGPMIIIGLLFSIFGYTTWINGILIPYLKIVCQLKEEWQSYLVATAFFIAYPVMAIPSSEVLKRTGYKKGMAIGLLVMVVGYLVFIAASKVREYNIFLGGLFIIGSGLALLQTAANPYVSKIGPIESAASRISIMGLCNKVAGILASLLFGYIALSDTDALETSLKTMDEVTRNATLDGLADRVVLPNIIYAVFLVIIAFVIYKSSLPELKEDEPDTQVAGAPSAKTSIFQFPHLLIGVLALFLYVGAEVIAGDTIISYGKSLGIEMSKAKLFTTATLTCMAIGYIVGIFLIPRVLSQQLALKISAVLGIVFSLLGVVTTGEVSVFFFVMLGLANALMWPAIFPLAVSDLGKFTKTGSALLIMGIAGGAILPPLYGVLVESVGSQQAYLMLVPCYAIILYFAVTGYKAGKTVQR